MPEDAPPEQPDEAEGALMESLTKALNNFKKQTAGTSTDTTFELVLSALVIQQHRLRELEQEVQDLRHEIMG